MEEAASDKRVNIEDAVEDISWSDKDLMEYDAGDDEDVDTGMDGNFGTKDCLVKIHKILVRLVRSYVGMLVHALTDGHSCEVEGIGIGMVSDYGRHKRSVGEVVVGSKTMVQGDHMAVVDSP